MSTTPNGTVACPKCGSTDVRHSYSQTAWDFIMDLLFSMDAFRCRSCRARFHKYDPANEEETPNRHKRRREEEEELESQPEELAEEEMEPEDEDEQEEEPAHERGKGRPKKR